MDELSDMNTLLEKMDDAADELDPQAKKWRRDIIDMSYDIEDCIDDFMDNVGEASDKQVGILKKASHYLTTFKDRYRIASQINEIKTRVIEASKRRDRYSLNVCTSSSTTKVDVDPRLSALYKDSTSLVGIDTQKEDLVKWAEDEDKQLKVMSIVGYGGLGKTTLANEVYLEVKGNFNCSAFVPVSQKPDVLRLLSRVCSKLSLPQSSRAFEVKELIDTLREYLRDKRYFIVLDDLWEAKHWDIISCAFPRNNQQNRLIVTTRIEGVARACHIDVHGCIHYMKPLSDVDSRKLFYRRIFGNEDTCPPPFIEISCEILKKCGGLPLAIVTMASTLVDQPIEQWEYIKRSIVTESAANSLDDMMQILDLSYKHLPRHLRACFLYLGIYPEDYEIERDELINLWVAERIVMSKSSGQDARNLAESYFNELVNRNMIQPDKFHYYKVHDMMLDLIVKRCKEDNFVSVVHSAQVVVERQDRVHRLSVNFSGAADDDTILQVATSCCQSQVRSLVLFGASKKILTEIGASKWMPPLSKLKALRVLYLKELPQHLMRMDFTGVGQLSQLRYFRIDTGHGYSSDTYSIVLPSEIWRLQHLERLEIHSITIRNTPSDIIEMPCLSHLILPFDTSLPVGIGKIKSLRTLENFRLEKSSPENIKGLGELNKLQEICLNVWGNGSKERRPRRTDGDNLTTILIDALAFSMEKLSNLKKLQLTCAHTAMGGDALSLLSPPFDNLEILDLDGLTFSRVPRWIGDLPKLCFLYIGVKQMPQEDISVIGTLPSLLELFLWIPGVPTHKVVIGGSMGFKALKFFGFNSDLASYLVFENGAMPNLRRFELILDAHEWDKATPLGLQYLSSLEEIIVGKLSIKHNFEPSDSELELVSRVFQEAADAHPNHPAFVFDKENWYWRAREEAQD